MSISAYCGECDKTIEIVTRNIIKKKTETGTEIYIECPWCEEREIVAVVK